MSERTDTKLRETKFFFQSLVRESDKESPSEPEAFLFYLNAFLTAGESVRCFLEEDYGYERRKAGGVFKFMNELAPCRRAPRTCRIKQCPKCGSASVLPATRLTSFAQRCLGDLCFGSY